MQAISTLSATADARKSDDATKTWRDRFKIHPVAELFPMMSEDELRELGEDIKEHGLKNRLFSGPSGRARRPPCSMAAIALLRWKWSGCRQPI